MKERPINLKAWEVRAILDGRKTQTRRIVKNQPEWIRPAVGRDGIAWGYCGSGPENGIRCLYGQPGDRLWVRETHLNHALPGYSPVWFYRADDDEKPHDRKWIPSILMPRKASRITLEVESVRVERLNEISEEDAKAEGIERSDGAWVSYDEIMRRYTAPKNSFRSLWQSINGPESWAENPWVWVVTFRRV